MTLPEPSLASSMEFDNISNTVCWQPSRPSDPNMTEGRFLTLSGPLRAEMLSLLYDLTLSVIISYPFHLYINYIWCVYCYDYTICAYCFQYAQKRPNACCKALSDLCAAILESSYFNDNAQLHSVHDCSIQTVLLPV